MRMWMSAVFGVVLLAAPATWAQDAAPSIDEIVKKTNHTAYYQGQDGRAKVKMTITDSQGRTRDKEFVILRKDTGEDDGEQKFYVHFQLPADERGTVFMVWKHLDKDDDRWLYLPALDVVKRIAASDKRTSFMGSHFFYEDVSGRRLDADTHELVETTDNYYVLKNTPKNPGEVEFDSFTMYIHKTTFIPVKVEYTKDGGVYRTVTAEKVDTIQGNPTVTKSKCEDKRIGGTTEMTYDAVEYDKGLPDDIFSERYLRRPPRDYIQ